MILFCALAYMGFGFSIAVSRVLTAGIAGTGGLFQMVNAFAESRGFAHNDLLFLYGWLLLASAGVLAFFVAVRAL